MAQSGPSRQHLIDAVSRYAQSIKSPVTIKQFCRATKVTEEQVHQHFPGGIADLLKAAELSHRAWRRSSPTFGQLMEAIEKLSTPLRRAPAISEMARRGDYAPATYIQRLGSWGRTMEAFSRWRCARGLPALPAKPPTRPPGGAPWHGKLIAGTVGKPLHTPGMLFAPTCESGVVFLFGLLARDLGYTVEHIGTAFPDCMALKEVGRDRWKRLRVEFEHKSSNFRAHGHDLAGCDVIVCWENDWKDCPVEVVELKSKIEELRKAA